MTGNNKVWRAPLAGLASLAMIATMGVAAGTANAVETGEGLYTVTLHADGKFISDGSSYVKTLEIQDTNRDGLDDELKALTVKSDTGDTQNFVFTGWYTADGIGNGEAYDPTQEVGADTDLYAHYAPADEYVNVVLPTDSETTFTAKNNYNYTSGSGFKVAYGDKIADWQYAAVDAKDGNHVLFDHYTNTKGDTVDLANLDGKALAKYIPGTTTTEKASNTLTLKAVNDTNAAVVNLYADGWTYGGAKTKFDAHKNQPVTLPTATGSNGKTTTTYYDADNTSKSYTGSFTPVADNVTLVPDSKASVDTYTVTYKGSHSSYTDAVKSIDDFTEQVQANGAATKTAAPAAAKAGFKFLGWSLENYEATAFTKDVKLAISDLSKVTKNLTVYAVYAPESVTVTYYNGYGAANSVYKTQSYTDGDHFKFPADPTRDGYTFTGWTNTTGDEKGWQNFEVKTTLNGLLYSEGNQPKQVPTEYTAKWAVANVDTLGKYESRVPESFLKKDATNYKSGSDQNVFTAASFDQYVKDWQTYKQDKKAKGSSLTSADVADLIKELSGFQNKLVFKTQVTVYRFEKNGLHIYAQGGEEVDFLKANGWKNEAKGNFETVDAVKAVKAVNGKEKWDLGDVYDAYTDGSSDSTVLALLTRVSRLREKASGQYMLTADQNEIDVLGDAWKNETFSALYTPVNGTTPVYRLHVKYSNEHLVTADANEYFTQSANTSLFHGDGIKFYL